jgi:hypothetical protein
MHTYLFPQCCKEETMRDKIRKLGIATAMMIAVAEQQSRFLTRLTLVGVAAGTEAAGTEADGTEADGVAAAVGDGVASASG